MSNRNLGLASPPMTPPYNNDSTYKNKSKNKSPEIVATPRQRKNKLDKNKNNRISTASSINSVGGMSFGRASTLPNLQKLVIPEELMPVGPNGERIPIMIPDGNGGLIPFTGVKKSLKKKNKSISSPAISQLASPTLSEIDENKVSSDMTSPSTPRLRERPKSRRNSTMKKTGKRHSILVPLNSSTPTTPLSPNSGEISTTSAKNVPLFIIPTGKDGKIDPSLLPTPMSSSELKERQKEYAESVILDDDGRSFILSPNRKGSGGKHGKGRKNSISSMRSNVTTPANFLNNKSKSEAGEFGKRRKNRKSRNKKSLLKNDNMSLYSVESNLLDGIRNHSESSPNLIDMKNKKSDSLYNDNDSECSTSNFSLRNIDSNNSSIYDDQESETHNSQEAFENLSPEKKDTALLIKKKIDDCIEAAKTIKDGDLKFDNLQYIANNIQLLPIALHEVYRKNLIKIIKKAIQSSSHGDTLYLLGNLYTSGFPGIATVELQDFKPNYNKAYNCFYQGFKIHHQECSFYSAISHELGLGTKIDLRKAYQIYQKAATLNHPGAMCRLGLACLNGELNMRTNLKEGVRWLRLSTMYANKQYPQAYYHLSTIYERGIPNLIIRDFKYAIQLLEKAASLGHIKSQYKLGMCYQHGELGVEVDAKTSMKYFGMAAAKGHGDSMFELAGWYLTGSEVSYAGDGENKSEVAYIIEPSNETAFQWTRKAAERNLPKAEFAIGYFYDNGIGINKDPEEAMKWYYVASFHKDPKAIKKMSEDSSEEWLKQRKSSQLVLIEKEIYSKPCNFDLIEDELNLHFTTETIYDDVLNCDTIKTKNPSDDSGSTNGSGLLNTQDKCMIM